MLPWLVPLSLFPTLAAMYVGGAPIRIEGGGGMRQIAGLLTSLVLYLVVWAVLRGVLGSVSGPTAALVGASVVSAILIPLACRVGFRIMGVRITKGETAPGHGPHAAA